MLATVTVGVHDNFYDAPIPDGASGNTPHEIGGPPTAAWLDSDGQVVPKGS